MQSAPRPVIDSCAQTLAALIFQDIAMELARQKQRGTGLLAGAVAAFVSDIDKTSLDVSPAFDKSNWPDINDPKTMSDIDRQLIILAPAPNDAAVSGGIEK